jgi:hypothetical protein
LDGFAEKKNVNYVKAQRAGQVIQVNDSDDSDNATNETTSKEPKSSGVIFPSNRIKRVWDLVIMVLLIYTATYVPFRVCFIDDGSDGFFIWECLVDSLFFIDIVLNFFTVN